MMKQLFNLTSENEIANANIKKRISVFRSRSISVSYFIYIVMFVLLSLVNRDIYSGLIYVPFMISILFLFNRRGKLDTSVLFLIIFTEICLSYILLGRKETYGISIMSMLYITSIVSIYSYSTGVIAVINIFILMLYMYQVHQLWTNVMYTRIIVQIAISATTFLVSYAINIITSNLSFIDQLRSDLVTKDIQLKNANELTRKTDESLNDIAASYASTQNGIKRRADIRTSIIPEISKIINALLVNREELIALREDNQRLEMAVYEIASMINIIKGKDIIFTMDLTSTTADSIILELNNRKISVIIIQDENGGHNIKR